MFASNYIWQAQRHSFELSTPSDNFEFFERIIIIKSMANSLSKFDALRC